MISRTTRRFRECFAKLPKNIQRQTRDSFRLFSEDSSHPSLRFKKIHATEPVFSARINIDYRAVGILEGEVIIWFWIGTHADYEKLIGQL